MAVAGHVPYDTLVAVSPHADWQRLTSLSQWMAGKLKKTSFVLESSFAAGAVDAAPRTGVATSVYRSSDHGLLCELTLRAARLGPPDF